MNVMLGIQKHLLKFFIMLCLVTGTCPIYTTQANGADAFDTMRLKYYTYMLGGAFNPADPEMVALTSQLDSRAQAFWSTMDKSGGRTSIWSDLPYPGNTNIGTSVSRLKTMAFSYNTLGSTMYHNTSLLSDIISALDWIHTNWFNATMNVPTGTSSNDNNWFAWEIGIPLEFTGITTLLYDHLSSAQVTNYMNAVNHFIGSDCSKLYNTINTGKTSNATGANLAWKCSIQIQSNMLAKNGTKISEAVGKLVPLFDYPTKKDGFHEDGSFIQHGYLSYTGGYGLSFLTTVSEIVYLLHGSTWEYTNANLSNLYSWIYDAYQPLIYRGAMMDMTMGREISRKPDTPNTVTGIYDQEHQKAQSYVSSLILLSNTAPPADAERFKRMAKGMVEADTYSPFPGKIRRAAITPIKELLADPAVIPINDLNLHKTYGWMDRIVHQRPEYAVGISMFSNRIQNYEALTKENIKGWYTAYGMVNLYTAQDLGLHSDYFWPTVNPYRLPGTTVDTMTRANASNETTLMDNNWVGGVTLNHLYGAAGMDLKDVASPLAAKKSWFMFDDEIVALGAGITNTSANTVETIVENRKIGGSETLTVNGMAKPSTLGWSETMTGVNSVHLAGQNIGYFFPDGATVKGLRETRTGAYSDLATWNNPDPTPVSRNYMTLWLDHGIAPTNSKYSYTILPNKTSSEVNSYAANPGSIVLRNDATVQAVKNKSLNIIGANFWTDSTASVSVGTSSPNFLTSNKKASLMTHETGFGITAAVSDPTQANTGAINIEINKSAAGVVSKDQEITVTQLSPTIKFSVNVNGAKGKSFQVEFSYANDNTFTDNLDDWSKAFSHTTNWDLGGTNAAIRYEGDTSRAKRTSNTTESITYKLNGVDGFSAKIYYAYSIAGKVKFYTSPDNVTYTLQTVTQDTPVNTETSWYRTIFTNAGNLPNGTNYVKVEFLNDSNIWTPQLSQITLKQTINDPLDNWSNTYTHSANLDLGGTTSTNRYEGDNSRAKRNTASDGTIIYKLEGATLFSAKVYYAGSITDKIKFYTSADNLTYRLQSTTQDTAVNTETNWYRINFSSTSLPVDTKYIKIVLTNDSLVYTPQISEVTIK